MKFSSRSMGHPVPPSLINALNRTTIRAAVSSPLLGLGLLTASAVPPLFTDDADPVPPAKVQINNGWQYHKHGRAKEIFAPLNAVVGLNRFCDLGFTAGYQWRLADDGNADGPLDTTFSSKLKFLDQSKNWLSLGARLDFKVPTAPASKGLGTGDYDGGVVLLATKTVGSMSLDFNLGHTFADTLAGNFGDDELFIGQTIRYELSEQWRLVGETFLRLPPRDAGGAIWTFHGGIQFSLRDNLIVSATALTAAGPESPDFAAFLGFTWEF